MRKLMVVDVTDGDWQLQLLIWSCELLIWRFPLLIWSCKFCSFHCWSCNCWFLPLLLMWSRRCFSKAAEPIFTSLTEPTFTSPTEQIVCYLNPMLYFGLGSVQNRPIPSHDVDTFVHRTTVSWLISGCSCNCSQAVKAAPPRDFRGLDPCPWRGVRLFMGLSPSTACLPRGQMWTTQSPSSGSRGAEPRLGTSEFGLFKPRLTPSELCLTYVIYACHYPAY